MKSLTIPAAVLVAIASAAVAQNAPKPVSRADYVKNLDSNFARIDSNHDGSLSAAELGTEQQRELGLAKNALQQQALQALDSNHDGKLSADEFRAPQVAKFNKADANHDGTVTPAEAQAAAGKK